MAEGKSYSPEAAFVVNPEFAESGVLAELGPEELRLAQKAYNVLQAPHGELPAPVGSEPRTRPGDLATRARDEFANEEGLEAVATGFKALRMLAGEELYGGMEPVIIKAKGRHSPTEFLKLAEQNKLIIYDNRRDLHDLKFHFVGGLLADRSVTTITSQGARSGLAMGEESHVGIADSIDRISYKIQLIWTDQRHSDMHAIELRDLIEKLVEDAGLRDTFTDNNIREAVIQQVNFIQDLSNKRLFVDPSEAKRYLEDDSSTAAFPDEI